MAAESRPVEKRTYVTVDPSSDDADHCEFCSQLVEGEQECMARDAGRRCKA